LGASSAGDAHFLGLVGALSGNGPLELLYRLQDRIRFVAARQKERDTVPPELTEIDRAYQERVEAVTNLKQRLARDEVEHRKGESEAADIREKQKKYQTQLRSVQTSREYGAVLNEIDGVDKLLRSTEDRLLELEEEIETARADLATREASLPAETADHEEKLKDWRTAQRSIDSELESAREEIRKLEAQIPPRDRAEFVRLLEKKGGLAIVKVVNNSCAACHVKIRPAALQILKVGREIVYCDSCKRILYWDTQTS
jgi:predicted  nucleic acid-binding Zn-ribbon protein